MIWPMRLFCLQCLKVLGSYILHYELTVLALGILGILRLQTKGRLLWT